MENRSLYTFSKFMRQTLNSNNVDFRTDYKMLPEEHGDLYSKLAGQKLKIADIEKSDMIIVIGSNLIKEHPIVSGMKAYGGFIQYITHPSQIRAQLGSQPHPLALAA